MIKEEIAVLSLPLITTAKTCVHACVCARTHAHTHAQLRAYKSSGEEESYLNFIQ